MIDLIERRAAIDAITRKMVSIPTAGEKDLMGDVNRIRAEDISVIKRLPSAQPTHETRSNTLGALENRWIPVSERLPEVGHGVLFSRRSMGTREGCLQADGKWWQYRWNEMLNADQVTAWQPLPEPYQEDENE